MEFKNALRKLKIGLTSKEIDVLLKVCDENGDGQIDIKEFKNKF